MDNLRSVLSISLSRIPPGEILNGEIRYNNITKDTFVKLSGYYVKNYSNDELENLFYYIQNEYQEQSEYVRRFSKEKICDRQGFNVFDAILLFAFRVLQESNGEPVCQYEHLLRWRMTSHELDEDVFTTAFFAYRDIRYSNVYRDFSWRPVIRHNNAYLNKLLSQGMAENHFHLKGSAPQFPLSWISMMNNITSERFRKLLENYNEKRLFTSYYLGMENDHLYISYLKAALIRSYLFSVLMNKEFALFKGTDVDKLLYEKDEILFHRYEIQCNISRFKEREFLRSKKRKNEQILDYMLNGAYNHEKSINKVNHLLSGERWFMYIMFKSIYIQDKDYEKYFNFFYAYLVIKETIRSELVQINNNIGFDNFAQYQNRKEDFIEDTEFEKKYIEMAVKGTLSSQNIRSMEARISPKDTAEKNRDNIRKLDNWICKRTENLKERYFFVFHFIKEKDRDDYRYSDSICRHYMKRKELKKQAQEIARFRECYPTEAARVKGIDACANEIGCRPEVFSQIYRFLRNHIVYEKFFLNDMYSCDDPIKMHQLSLTYHIGEDYLDIIDGLRAIDEAIRFLRLDCGSRIGHAIALGLDVKEYYEGKNYKILINQQDYLDNLVWTYND